jgi:hypothetical protein
MLGKVLVANGFETQKGCEHTVLVSLRPTVITTKCRFDKGDSCNGYIWEVFSNVTRAHQLFRTRHSSHHCNTGIFVYFNLSLEAKNYNLQQRNFYEPSFYRMESK